MTTPKYFIVALLSATVCLTGCQKMEQNKLNRQMKKMAKIYLQQEQVTEYQKLTITSVDTLTEYGYTCVHPDGAFYLFMKSPEQTLTEI